MCALSILYCQHTSYIKTNCIFLGILSNNKKNSYKELLGKKPSSRTSSRSLILKDTIRLYTLPHFQQVKDSNDEYDLYPMDTKSSNRTLTNH